MTARRVLYLTEEALTVHRFQYGRLRESFAFSNDPLGLEGYRNYLAAHAQEPALLLADLAAEEFHVETLPHVAWHTRAQLHSRHAQRLFAATPFRTAVVLERLTSGRRDDRVLFSALTHSELLARWLEPLAAVKTPLAGIGSVPHVSGALLGMLGLRASHLLLVSTEEGAGLRQSLFCAGKLRMSRLTALPKECPEADARFVCEEIGRTLRYLQHLQLIPSGCPMLTCLVTGEPAMFTADLFARNDVSLQVVGLREAAQRLGLPPSDALDAGALFAHLYARVPRNRYAAAAQLRHRDARQLRLGLRWAGLGGITLLLLLSGINGLRIVEHRQAARAAQDANERYAPGARRLLANLPIDMSAGQLQGAVESAERLRAVPMDPGHAMGRIGQTLEAFPEMAVRRLFWRTLARGDDGVLQLADEGGESLHRMDALTPAAPGMYHGLLVEGEVTPHGSARQTLARFNALLAAVKAIPEVASVNAFVAPFDSAGRISGGTTLEGSVRPPFLFGVVFRP